MDGLGLADGADPERRVWVDVFAVRQWPGNAADLCFDLVVQQCTSFVIVCGMLETFRGTGGNMRVFRADRSTGTTMTNEEMRARQVRLAGPAYNQIQIFPFAIKFGATPTGRVTAYGRAKIYGRVCDVMRLYRVCGKGTRK